MNQPPLPYRGGVPDGFTVIELLVVLAAIALLLSVAAPTYMRHLDAARDVALKQDLFQVRDAIDKFRADQGRYPASLDDLVTRKYLRALPEDPVTRSSSTWILIPPSGASTGPSQEAGVFDIKSGASGSAQDGTAYASW